MKYKYAVISESKYLLSGARFDSEYGTLCDYAALFDDYKEARKLKKKVFKKKIKYDTEARVEIIKVRVE